MTVAALFVDPKGPYIGLPGVDPWDEARDARLYNETHPVVAHPPCARWSSLAPLVEACHGYRVGEDAGCFAAALDAVRRCGGVIEHPAKSLAWARYGLTAPSPGGGWIRAGWDDTGWTCEVAQRSYGHRARKRTWLYAVGVDLLPSLTWGDGPAAELSMNVGGGPRGRRLKPHEYMGDKAERIHTPEPFRDVLLAMARSVRR